VDHVRLLRTGFNLSYAFIFGRMGLPEADFIGLRLIENN
jgi:hypothetical protein